MVFFLCLMAKIQSIKNYYAANDCKGFSLDRKN